MYGPTFKLQVKINYVYKFNKKNSHSLYIIKFENWINDIIVISLKTLNNSTQNDVNNAIYKTI